MPRCFAHIKYNGHNYAGWQRQPNAPSVQEAVEVALSTFYREPISVVGCGRTDSGVHASFYVLHFEMSHLPDMMALKGLNAILPEDISIFKIYEVADTMHARYSCSYRAYSYFMHRIKDPFLNGNSFHFHRFDKLDRALVDQAASMIMEYGDFFPFCKSNSGVEHYKCQIFKSEWQWDESKATYHVAANRFLRGMVRLLVGAQLNVGLGQISLGVLETSLQQQSRLTRDWSVPGEGLFLSEVRYD